jgi:DNA-binding transcriptional ArsR family regulator
MRILGLLRVQGKSTVTGICSKVGVASGSASYHLAQLEHAGLVEQIDSCEADGDGRKRWWRACQQSMAPAAISEHGGDQSINEYLHAVSQTYRQTYDRFVDQRESLEPEWMDAAMNQDRIMTLSIEQLVEMNAEFDALARHWEQVGRCGVAGTGAGGTGVAGVETGVGMDHDTDANVGIGGMETADTDTREAETDNEEISNVETGGAETAYAETGGTTSTGMRRVALVIQSFPWLP